MQWDATAKWVAVLYVANVVDMVLTTYWIHAYQIQEANPLLRAVWLLDPLWFIGVKVVAVGALAGFLVLTVRQRWSLWLLATCALIYLTCLGYHLWFALYQIT